MTYQLYEKPLGHTSLDFDLVDGDMKKVENEDRSIDIGINPPELSQVMRFGRRVKTEFLPTRIRPLTNQSRMPDFAIVRLAQICSAKFRDVVEALEPGVHQFVPVEVVRKNGDHLADMFWFVPCNRLDTLQLDLLRPPLTERGFYTGLANEPRTVFSRSKIGNHHVWIDKRMVRGFIWVSDKFHDAAVEAGLIGLNLVAKETV
ncbi:imm11 family protein [Tabrizicola sp.]|uniref:imm11 family protein n=1 Tax=Tabrizicola sp. TaxID=2005166 RepID=UPI002FDDC83B